MVPRDESGMSLGFVSASTLTLQDKAKAESEWVSESKWRNLAIYSDNKKEAKCSFGGKEGILELCIWSDVV